MSPSLRFLLLSSFFIVLLFSVSANSGRGAEDSGGDTHNLRSRSLIVTKICCLIIVFFATFLAGLSPYVLRWSDGFLVLGTQFAGGVFLGTAMMHFLCDANKTFEGLTQKKYPFAYMLACFGYLITMLADCVVSSIFLRQSGRSSYGAGVKLEGVETGKANDNSVTSKSQHHVHAALASASSFGDTALLIMALCFHSLFEGIAIGVAETKANAWRALWTVSLHKIFAAIAMGIALLRMIPNRPLLSCAAYSFLFAISSPVGIAIGIIIDATTQGAVADWIFAITIGLACGVFIYVTINHLLSKGYETQKPLKVDTPSYKFLSVLLGIGVIAVVMIWD